MTPKPATLRPETAEFLGWCQNWLTEKGYTVQERLPWKSWRWSTPTVIYGLNGRGQSVFGLLAHLTNMNDLVKRLGLFMCTKPRPRYIYIFVPRNSPHEIRGELVGSFSYDIQIVEGPDYPYDSKYYEGEMWGSTFSISLCKRGSKPKE